MRHPHAAASRERDLTEVRFILNTRPAVYQARMEAAFAGCALPLVHWPLFSPQPTPVAWPDPAGFDAVIFTSRIAVGFAPVGWRAHMAFVVGEGTEEAAREAGFQTIIRTGQDAADMTRALQTATFRRAFYASGTDITTDLALQFPEKVERCPVYDMVAEERVPDRVVARMQTGQPIALLFSRRAASHLAALLSRAGLSDRPIDAVGIGSGVFDAAPGPWRVRAVASVPTLDGVVTAVRQLAKGEDRP